MAALYGQVEAVRELLNHVPSYLKSAYPASEATCIVKEFGNDADLTPLHLASFAGMFTDRSPIPIFTFQNKKIQKVMVGIGFVNQTLVD